MHPPDLPEARQMVSMKQARCMYGAATVKSLTADGLIPAHGEDGQLLAVKEIEDALRALAAHAKRSDANNAARSKREARFLTWLSAVFAEHEQHVRQMVKDEAAARRQSRIMAHAGSGTTAATLVAKTSTDLVSMDEFIDALT